MCNFLNKNNHMKKSLFFILFGLLFSVTAVQAQKTGFGLRAGINTDEVGDQIKIGPHAGIYYNIMLADNFAIQPEILYSYQASSIPINNANERQNLSYINIPVMAKLYVAQGLSVDLGPYFGFLMSARSDDDADLSLKADFPQTDYGLAAGASYELPGGFNFGGRYNLGLADVSEGLNRNGAIGTVDKRYTNQFAQFFIGYTF